MDSYEYILKPTIVILEPPLLAAKDMGARRAFTALP
jgi:hypothetical protein